jgi:c-di-GMP-binding flagellar brake protein YcgR
MKDKKFLERRNYVRVDLETKVNFRVRRPKGSKAASEKVVAVSRNVSVEGICFTSPVRLKEGTLLDLEIFVPNSPKPLNIKGEVRWSQPFKKEADTKKLYNTGVRLVTIEKNDEGKFILFVSNKMIERLARYLHL